MSILACHQPNFIPWLPFFDKMNKADIFVLLVNVQYEKNGWQNRCEVNGKKWTMPVERGLNDIKDKHYVNGQSLPMLNIQWINSIAMTLGIETDKIRLDFATDASKTDRIIELCHKYECDQYLTNPDAMEKYLDEEAMNFAGIEVISHMFGHRVHIFEAMHSWGVEGVQKLLAKEKIRCAI